MFPKLFELPLFGDIPTTWPVFIGICVALIVIVSLAPRLGEKSKLLGQLAVVLPVAAFVTAFVTFVQTPFKRLPINSYGFSIMVGFLLASWVAVRRGKPLGYKSDFILDVGIIGMIFGIVGAKVNYVLQYGDQFKPERDTLTVWGDMGLNPIGALVLGAVPFAFWWWRTKGQAVRLYSWQHAVLLFLTLVFALAGARALFLYQHRSEYSWKVFEDWQRGFVLYGGLIAGVAASILYIKMRKESVARVADLAAAPTMLALAFGRFGCFLNGCCFGQEGSGFPCISFPSGSPPAIEIGMGPEGGSRPVHPTQLYETAAALVFFAILSWLGKRKRKAEGELFLMMAMMYSGWRFFIEFARGDKRPEWIGALTYSQVMSLAIFAVVGIWLYIVRNRAPRAAVPPAPHPATTP